MKKRLLATCLFFSCLIGSLSAGPCCSKEKKTPDQLLEEALGDSFKKTGPDIKKMEKAIRLGADVNRYHDGDPLLNLVGHMEHLSALRLEDDWMLFTRRSIPRSPSLYAKAKEETTECLLEHGAWNSINEPKVKPPFYDACLRATNLKRSPADFARIELMLLYGGPNETISANDTTFNKSPLIADVYYDVARYLLVYKLAEENPKFLEMLQQPPEKVTDESLNNVLTDDQRELASLCLWRGRTPVTYKRWKSSYYGPSGAENWYNKGSPNTPLTMYIQWQSTRDHATEKVRSKAYCNASLQAGVTLPFLTWCWQISPTFRHIDIETFVFDIAEKYFTFPAMEQKLGPPLILKTLPYFNLHNHPDEEIACRVRRLMAHTEEQENLRKEDLVNPDASASETESHL